MDVSASISASVRRRPAWLEREVAEVALGARELAHRARRRARSARCGRARARGGSPSGCTAASSQFAVVTPSALPSASITAQAYGVPARDCPAPSGASVRCGEWATSSACCRRPSRRARCAPGLSARELVAAHLARIERIDPLVNAIVTRTPERALAAADEADRRRARGDDLPPLHGLPIAHKDLQDTAGVRTTYGSPSYRDHVPDADSLLVARLREAGAILVGKTNTPEWGAGSHTFNPVFGATRNPWDTTRSAGGSSGGARRRAGLPHGAARRRQRPRRLAAQPGRLERRARPAPDARPRAALARVGALAAVRRRGPDGAHGGRSRAAAGRDGRAAIRAIRSRSARPRLDLAAPLAADLRGRRVAWSPTVGGLPIDARDPRRARGRARRCSARSAST